MKIDFSNLQYQCRLLKKEIDKNIQAVLNKNFRSSLAGNILYTYFNGTVALLLAMMAMNIRSGDIVVTTPSILSPTQKPLR